MHNITKINVLAIIAEMGLREFHNSDCPNQASTKATVGMSSGDIISLMMCIDDCWLTLA